ncbi:MAG: hypothetical protein JOZ27_09135 [Caulobacteraceae bacterium]|nr:hypothetical protein [Caulobacteraceae bacterium]
MKPGLALALCLALIAGAARSATTRCWIDHGALVVAASFGDIADDFIVDLAQPASELHLTQAQAAGLDGDAATAALSLAGVRTPSFSMRIVDLDARLRPFETTVAGVLGWDAFRGRSLTIRFSPCRVAIGEEWPPRRKGDIRLEATLAGGVPVVPAGLSDGLASRRDVMALGVGGAETRVADAQPARPAPEGRRPRRLRAVSFAGQIFENVPAGVSDAGPETLGLAVIQRFDLNLSADGRRLSLRPVR